MRYYPYPAISFEILFIILKGPKNVFLIYLFLSLSSGTVFEFTATAEKAMGSGFWTQTQKQAYRIHQRTKIWGSEISVTYHNGL